MATINSNLYPPIFKQSYMPAFNYKQKCRIYFAISVYNNISELHPTKPVQVIVQNQKTNHYALDDTKYPSGIMLTTLQKDTARAGQDKYYIQIAASDIKNGFTLNQYYKVQVRFTGADAATPPSSNTGIDGWLSENIKYFSQWSTVVLIYGISKPAITLTGFDSSKRTVFTSTDIPIVGKVTFENSQDKEKLKSYQIHLYDKKTNTLLQDSGIIYINNYQLENEINYVLKYNIEISTDYILKINIETNNLYTLSEPVSYTFVVSEQEIVPLDIDMQYDINDESGFIKIYLKNKYTINDTDKKYTLSNNNILLTGKSLYLALTPQEEDSSDSTLYIPTEMVVQNESQQTEPSEEGQGEEEEPVVQKDKTIGNFKSAVYIPNDNDDDDEDSDETLVLYNRENIDHDMSKGTQFIFSRSSNRDNFKKWQDVDIVTIQQDNVLDISWFDYTVQPGVWYKYKITRISSAGVRTGYIKEDQPLMIVPQDIFLEANGQQLRIRFDPQVDNFKRNISESLTQTIGSKYPYIRRNGNINYRTFGLSGTIMSFMNIKDNLLEASKEQLYQDAKNLYDQYNIDNNINPYNDYIYQRQFRNKVMDFLYNNNVKLYRSLTQGNILVKLMDISFTPNQTLGRLIYSFSCTVYEIGDCNIDNYQNYNIVKGKYKYNLVPRS